ncbi:hypothetical protein EYB25_000952 [Talaromyces marneffei]|uniref:uncharacterized protein n=1 Tax=Talaromyces marneffei TaxID=37727 RepID=UPI0012A86FD8|nr:uncharacterized protein EYB26_001379 [Talaromyces marneffei]KAE8556251.1 hypothetical protein EYB25_000952 [Talaromyces marneffei]QGA13729.1 hypothetical protein EYB26_001379 [Talaromyces marneffei]
MALTRVRFKVHGTVQGVSFRAFTQKRATEYGVTGWVRNTPDGRVCSFSFPFMNPKFASSSSSPSPSSREIANSAEYMTQVEGEVQGEPDLVQKLLKDVDKGPRHAHVVKLEKGEVETLDDEESFEIRR